MLWDIYRCKSSAQCGGTHAQSPSHDAEEKQVVVFPSNWWDNACEEIMMFILNNSINEEQQGVIRFLTAELVKQINIHHWMVATHGKNCVFGKTVRKWNVCFHEGQEWLSDDLRTGKHGNHGWSYWQIEWCDEKWSAYHTLKVGSDGREQFWVSSIVCNRLGYRKVWVQWVLTKLKKPEKTLCMGTGLQLLFWFYEDHAFLEQIVADDESWCHFFRTWNKEGQQSESPSPRKFKALSKVMLTVSFNIRCAILIEFFEHGKVINSDTYYEILFILHKSIKKEYPRLLKEGMILLHDNACSHISSVTQSLLTKFKWEQLKHSHYGLDISWNYHLFELLKKNISVGSTSTHMVNWRRKRRTSFCQATGILGRGNPSACEKVG